MVVEKLVDIAVDSSMNQIREWVKKGQAQKLLLSCFEKYAQNNKTDCCIDKNMILSVESKKIQPNLLPGELKKNLTTMFDKCIRVDDIDKKKSIENQICYDYLNLAKKEIMELYHIDEDIHKLGDEIKKNREKSSEQYKEILQEIKRNNISNSQENIWIWESEEPIVNKKCSKIISKYPKEFNIMESCASKEQYLEGIEALNIHIWMFMNTQKYKYKIYSDKYGTEYSEFLRTNDKKTFLRLAPLIAKELIEYEKFENWIFIIYGFKREGNNLLMDYGVKGNGGKIITINLLWKNDGSDIGRLQIH